MLTQGEWDWGAPRGQTRLMTVEDHILWSYAMLSVSREAMKRIHAGEAQPFPLGRTKAANIAMRHYRDGRRRISGLDRDDALAQDGAKVCAHCGGTEPRWHWDHLIVQSRLAGLHLPLNQVRSCPGCNLSRGNVDLMHWYRRHRAFPTLALLRRYLKLCHRWAVAAGCLAEDAAAQGLPFDPAALPRRFPPVAVLIWDHAHR